MAKAVSALIGEFRYEIWQLGLLLSPPTFWAEVVAKTVSGEEIPMTRFQIRMEGADAISFWKNYTSDSELEALLLSILKRRIEDGVVPKEAYDAETLSADISYFPDGMDEADYATVVEEDLSTPAPAEDGSPKESEPTPSTEESPA